MSKANLEVELKLELLAPVQLSDVVAALGDSVLGQSTRKQLTNTYFDTADGRLHARHMALRIRESNGRLTQTLKLGGEIKTLQQRTEWECHVDQLVPDLERIDDKEVRARIGLVFKEGLQPIFTTNFERDAIDIAWPPGRVGQSQIELALDRGRVMVGEGHAPIHEIELELKDGATRHLFDLAAHLSQSLPLRPGYGSKSDLGYRLYRGLPPQAVRAAPPALDKSLPVIEALPLMLREVCGQWIANFAPALDGRDPAGVHQLRVALRRLRSLITIFGPWFVPAAAREWQAVLRAQLRGLSQARQLDVFIEDTLLPLVALLPEEPALGEVLEIARERRGRVYQDLRQLLDDPAAGRYPLDCLCWIEQGAWRIHAAPAEPQLLGEAARQILDKRYRKIIKRGQGFDHMPMEQRHELRLTLKKLRYAVDFLAPLFDTDPVRRRALKKLQNELGQANDLNESRAVLAYLSEGRMKSSKSLALAKVDGIVAGWGLERLAKQEVRTAKAWQHFRKTPLFWEQQA